MTTFRNPAQWLLDYFNGGAGSKKVTANSALENAAFWYGVNKISGNVGTLPLNVMRRLPEGGAEKDKNHWAYRLLRQRPNEYQTPIVFKQAMTKDAILWGNGRAFIHRGPGVPELIPLRPDATITRLEGGRKVHLTMPDKDERLPDDMLDAMAAAPNKVVTIPDRDVLHLQGFGNGIEGMSLFRVARTSLGIGLAADERANRQMRKGITAKMAIEEPAESQAFRIEGSAKEFMKDLNKVHGADAESEEIMLLRNGMKANVLNMSNKDAEFIENRKFQRQEAALWLMLESILGDDTSVSYNSEEQKQLAYLKNCLSNWLVRWEDECMFKLLSDKEHRDDSHYVKFNTAALLRTDTQTTMSTLNVGVVSTILSPNEAREKLDMNPYDGGDAYQNPAITPGESGGVSDSDPSSDAVATSVVEAYMSQMLKVEQTAVNRMIAEGADHTKMDAWYGNWNERLGNAIEAFGGDRLIAQEHCVSSLQYLERKPETFDLTGTAELLAEKIMKSIGDSDDV